MNKEKRKKILLVILLIIIVLLLIGIFVKSEISKHDYKTTSATVSTLNAINDDLFAENVNMDYLYSDKVGLKISSLFINETDITFKLNFSFQENLKIPQDNLEYGYILYDENGNIYSIRHGATNNLIKELEQQDIITSDDQIHTLVGNSSKQYESFTDENVTIIESLQAEELFPKAEKLYLRLTGIGYKNENGNYKSLSNSNWLIELEIPQDFYEDSSVEFDIKEQVEGIDLESAIVTDTRMKVIVTIDGINGTNHNTCIIDGNGNNYVAEYYKYTENNPDRLITSFAVTKSSLPEQLFLRTYINDKEITVELEKIENPI